MSSLGEYFKRIRFEVIAVVLVTLLMLPRGFVAGSDGASSWYSPWYNLVENFYVWNTYNVPGNYASNSFTSFFLRLFYSLFELFTSNPHFVQKAAWITFFSVAAIIIFKIIKREFSNNSLDSLVLTFFVLFNPISQYYLWSKQHWAYYLVPVYFIAFTLYRKFVITKDRNYLFLIVGIWCLAGFAINQPAYFVPWALSILPVFLWEFFNDRELKSRAVFIGNNFLFLVAFILVNFVYLFPILLVGGEQLDSARAAYASGDQLPLLRDLSKVNTFHSLMGFTNGYTDTFGVNWIEIILWTSFILIMFYVFLIVCNRNIKNDEVVFFPLLIGLLLVMFLNKGLSPPFSEFSESFFSIREMYIFRDFKDKFALLFSLLIGVSVVVLIKYDTKLRYMLYIVTFISLISFAFTLWLPKNFEYSDTLSYIKSVNLLNNTTYRVLNLPLVNYSFYYTKEPDYNGDSPLKNIFKKDVIYTSGQQQNGILYLKESLSSESMEPIFLEAFLREYGVRYIFNNKNSFVREDKEPDLYDYSVLNKFNFLHLMQDTQEYQVYEYLGYYPKILARNAYFIKESNVSYRVYISHLNTTNLVFLDAYHPGWKLFFVKNPSKLNCENGVEFVFSNQKECSPKDANFAYKFFPDLFILLDFFNNSKNTFFEHSKFNPGFFTDAPINNWKLDSGIIKENYDKNYYIENEDGTIDVEIIVFFEKQIYFLFGFLVSILSWFVLTALLFKRFLVK